MLHNTIHQNPADKLLDIAKQVEPEEQKKIALAINILKGKMKENAKAPDVNQTKEYVTLLTKQALEKGTLLSYNNDELSKAKKSTQNKEVIREIIKQFDVVADLDNPALTLAWNRVKKSCSVLELRNNLEMYIAIKENTQKENIQEYVDMIDDLDKQVQELLEYKRIQGELFDIVREDDIELKLLSDIENTKKDFILNDVQVCKMFNCDRNKLNYLRRKFELTVC